MFAAECGDDGERDSRPVRQWLCQGSISSTPVSPKCWTFLVATAKPCARTARVLLGGLSAASSVSSPLRYPEHIRAQASEEAT